MILVTSGRWSWKSGSDSFRAMAVIGAMPVATLYHVGLDGERGRIDGAHSIVDLDCGTVETAMRNDGAFLCVDGRVLSETQHFPGRLQLEFEPRHPVGIDSRTESG